MGAFHLHLHALSAYKRYLHRSLWCCKFTDGIMMSS